MKLSVLFFRNEVIFVQLDELDRITYAWIGFNYVALNSSVMIRVADR